jgi:hypothetical protein
METLPSIEVITMWYNEAFLAPFFLNHYAFANHIRVINDAETTDNTKEIVSKYPNASIEYIKFPEGFDNDIAVAKLNKCYAESMADWVIAPDADEFVFHEGLHEVLMKETEGTIYVRLFQVYRHKDDADLDPAIPIRLQRRHGDPNAVKGRNGKGMKPIVVRTGLRRMKWQPGQHNIWSRRRYGTSATVLLGAHWAFADPSFCAARRLRGKMRQSPHNLLVGHGNHYNSVNEEKVRIELEQHLNDERLF